MQTLSFRLKMDFLLFPFWATFLVKHGGVISIIRQRIQGSTRDNKHAKYIIYSFFREIIDRKHFDVYFITILVLASNKLKAGFKAVFSSSA